MYILTICALIITAGFLARYPPINKLPIVTNAILNNTLSLLKTIRTTKFQISFQFLAGQPFGILAIALGRSIIPEYRHNEQWRN